MSRFQNISVRAAGMWLLRILGGGVIFVLLAVVVILGLLQTPWGADQARQIAVARANSAVNGTVTLERLDGNFVSHLKLYNIGIARADTSVVRLDSLSISYSIVDLLSRTIRLRSVDASSLDATLQQYGDGSWNVARLLPEPAEQPVDTAASAPWTIIVDRLALDDSQLETRFHAPGRDSVIQARGIELVAEALRFGPDTPVGQLSRFSAEVTPFNPEARFQIRTRASVDADAVRLDSLRIKSSRSEIFAEARYPWSSSSARPDDIHAFFEARPLAFADLKPFLPSLPAQDNLELSARLIGSAEDLVMEAKGNLTGDGHFTLNAAFTPPGQQPLRYEASARLQNIDVARLTGRSTGLTNMSAEVSMDLQGPSLQQLTGETHFRADQLEWNDQAIRPTVLNSTWKNGRTAFSGHAELVRGSLTVEGEANPFADIPAYRLTSRFNHLNLRRLPGMVEETDLTGQLSLSGSQYDPEQMSLDAELTLQSSRYGSYEIESGRLGARIDQETVALDSELALQGGSFSARARLRPFDTPATYELSDGRFRNVNLATLTGDTTMASRLSGSFAASGEGFAFDSMSVDGAVELDGSSYLDRDIERGELQAGLHLKELSFSGGLTTPGGALQFEGSGRPMADIPSLDRFSAAFRNLDIGYLLQDSTQTSRFNGVLTAQASGLDPASARAEAQLRLDSSRVNQQEIRRVTSSVFLADGTMTIDLTGDLPEGEWALQGTVRPFDSVPRYTFENTRFTGLNLGPWLAQPQLETNLTGRADLRGFGFDPDSATVTGQIQLDSSRVNRLTVESGTVDLELRDRRLSSTLDVTYPTGSSSISAAADVLGEPVSFSTQGRIRGLSPFELAGIDTLDSSLSLRFDISGRGQTLSSMDIGGTISSGSSQLDEISIDSVYAQFALEGQSLQTDTLVVESNVLDLGAAGRLALPNTSAQSKFAFDGSVKNLSPLGKLAGFTGLQGRGTLSGRVFNASPTIRVDVESSLTNVAYAGMSAAQVEMRLLGDYDDSLALQIQTSARALSAATIVVDRIDANALYANEAITFDTEWMIDSEREGLFRGRVDLRPGQERAVIDSLSMRMEEQQWELSQEASITYADDFRIDGFQLSAGNQQFAVDGIFSPAGDHDLITTIDQVHVDPFIDLFGYEGVGGRLNGSIILTGPAQSPELTSSLALQEFSAHQREVGSIALELSYRDYLMNMEATLAQPTGRELKVSGSVPFDLSIDGPPPPADQTLDVSARADSIALAWVEPFVDPTVARDINGFLTADLQVGGTYQTPNTEGFFRVSRGTMLLPELGTRYSDINLRVNHQDTTATIQRASMRSGDGRMTVDGVVHLSALNVGTFDLEIDADNFRAANISSYRLSVDTDMTMRGTTTRPVIRGDVTLTRGTFNVDEAIASEEVEPISLSQEDIQVLQSRFGIYVSEEAAGSYDFYEAMTIDTLNVNITRDVWLRSASAPEMAIEFTGDLTVVKPNQGEMEAFGTIQVIPTRSYIAQFGRRFDITAGTLTFNGPIYDPILNLEAEYNMRSRATAAGSAQINLGLDGPLDDLRFNLGSDQGLSNVEIISYLVLGRPPGQTERGSSTVESVATTAALSQLTQAMEGLAANELGLDVIEIQHDQEFGATLTAGAYLTSNLFASVSWPISLTGQQSPGTTTRRITIEYILSNWLVLQLQRESEALGLKLLWEYSY